MFLQEKGQSSESVVTLEISPCVTRSYTAKIGIGSARQEGAAGPNGGHQQGGGPNGQGMPPGFSEAAEALGTTEQALMEALQSNGGRNADLSAVAADLGVSEAELKAALPKPPRR